jgi:GDP-L-fucose synthase
MLQRFHAAKLSGATEAVVCWGTGQARREFLHVEDLARACLLLMECYSDERPINVGSGEEVSIEALAQMVREAVGFAGELRWDTSKPDGTPRKVMDSHRVRELGWSPRVGLPEGLALAYADFLTMRPRHRAAGSD